MPYSATIAELVAAEMPQVSLEISLYSHTPLAGCHTSSYSSLWPYVNAQIVTATVLLSKCLTVRYFSF